MLSLVAQCIVIGPVCGVCGGRCLWWMGGWAVSVTMITQNSMHRSVGADSDHLQLIKFWWSCVPGKGVCSETKNFGMECLHLSERFFHLIL